MFVCLLPVTFLCTALTAQIDAGLFRFPDVSKTQIVFTYANDIWIIAKDGGNAAKLSSPAGVESYPKFSPDGKSIAFTGNYDGNKDVYTMPVAGGVPLRLTQHGGGNRTTDWTNDGKKVLFASIRESGKYRFAQFYTVPASGGPAEKLPLAYAEFGAYSPDGKQMALNFRTQVGRNWKRYRGGWNADIHIFNFETLASENISAGSDGADEFPMWHENYIYFLSDRGAEQRMNLWRYEISSSADHFAAQAEHAVFARAALAEDFLAVAEQHLRIRHGGSFDAVLHKHECLCPCGLHNEINVAADYDGAGLPVLALDTDEAHSGFCTFKRHVDGLLNGFETRVAFDVHLPCFVRLDQIDVEGADA